MAIYIILSYYPKNPNKDHFWLWEILDLKKLTKRYQEAFKLKFYYVVELVISHIN